MKKTDYMNLIKIAEGSKEIERTFRSLYGNDCGAGEGSAISKINTVNDVLSSYARPEYNYTGDGDCSKQFLAFNEVIKNMEMSLEEKYTILIGE